MNLIVKLRDGDEIFIDRPWTVDQEQMLYVDRHDCSVFVPTSQIRHIRMVAITRDEYRRGADIVQKILEEE